MVILETVIAMQLECIALDLYIFLHFYWELLDIFPLSGFLTWCIKLLFYSVKVPFVSAAL